MVHAEIRLYVCTCVGSPICLVYVRLSLFTFQTIFPRTLFVVVVFSFSFDQESFISYLCAPVTLCFSMRAGRTVAIRQNALA